MTLSNAYYRALSCKKKTNKLAREKKFGIVTSRGG